MTTGAIRVSLFTLALYPMFALHPRFLLNCHVDGRRGP